MIKCRFRGLSQYHWGWVVWCGVFTSGGGSQQGRFLVDLAFGRGWDPEPRMFEYLRARVLGLG